MYTNAELAALGEQIAVNGTDHHARDLRDIAMTVRHGLPGAAAVLLDPEAPEVLRQRAFTVAADFLSREGTVASSRAPHRPAA